MHQFLAEPALIYGIKLEGRLRTAIRLARDSRRRQRLVDMGLKRLVDVGLKRQTLEEKSQ
jgi:hypothetical protein